MCLHTVFESCRDLFVSEYGIFISQSLDVKRCRNSPELFTCINDIGDSMNF